LLRSIFYLDLHKARDLRPANRALIGLHSDDLRALDAETHVSARKHYRVLGCGKTHDTFTLGFICDVGRRVVYTVNVVHLKDCIVEL
jgi:hypothetical protein